MHVLAAVRGKLKESFVGFRHLLSLLADFFVRSVFVLGR